MTNDVTTATFVGAVFQPQPLLKGRVERREAVSNKPLETAISRRDAG